MQLTVKNSRSLETKEFLVSSTQPMRILALSAAEVFGLPKKEKYFLLDIHGTVLDSRLTFEAAGIREGDILSLLSIEYSA